MTPEGRTKAIVKKWLKSNNIPHWAIVPSVMGNSTGVSDYIGILPDGKFLAIECKASGKKNNTTEHQKNFLAAINNNKGYAFVISDQDDMNALGALLFERYKLSN